MATSLVRDHQQYSCSVCLDLMEDPVTIPCGHSYCMVCIKSYWDKDRQRRPQCPQCRQNFVQRPVLNKNTMLAEIMEQLRNTELQEVAPAEARAGAGDIGCDFCTGKKVSAVKSCLECRASYCETHLQPHYDFPALARHKLVNPTFMPTCQKHDKLLEVFCRTDQKCICALCLLDDHKGHDTVSCEEERNEKQVSLKVNKKKCVEKCKEKEKELSELEKACQAHALSGNQAVEDTEKAFIEIIAIIQGRCSEVIEKIKAQEKADLGRLGDRREQLELEIAMLRGQGDVQDKLLLTEDNVYFLQNYENVLTPSGVEDCPNQSLELVNTFGNMSKTVSDFRDRLEDFCKQEADKLLGKDSSAKTSPGQIKPGDRVRVKSSVKTPKFNWGSHVTHKSTGVVKAVHDNSLIVNFPGHQNWKGVLSEMELVGLPDANGPGASAQNSCIKVGDQVRVKPSVDNPKHKWGGVSHQSVGVVKSLDGENMIVDFPEHSRWSGTLSEMEVVSADDVSGSLTVNSLCIGDKVKVKATVVTPEHSWGHVTHQSVGVITDIKQDAVIVDFPECKAWKGLVSEMELISSKDITGRFRVGDRVRVKGSVSPPANGWGKVSHKSVGVVTALRDDSMTVDFPEHKCWKAAVSEMELAPNPDSELCKFKLGERVRVKTSVTIPKYNWGSVNHQSVGTVKAFKVVVDFPEQPDWAGDPSEMEPAA